ncbi:MAG: tRNA (adenosine(37)-N6)-threonylcarbamoyltransferase complex ATPase subunit type 1 TsaE [Treponema sp.]|nr:tRNA (adenosine(37)-N6)-threonylcarbamoyltransferase complex ATPase subunit type 1 TsaE [Treponema sp.]
MTDFPLEITLESKTPEETFNIGKRIAAHLCAGSVLALDGTLGSGKTCLIKGIASFLGIKENITSPTYTIINEYQLEPNKSFYHIDAYRLNDDRDFEETGGLEVINDEKGISVIEWSYRIKNSLPKHTIHVFIDITGKTSRTIKIKGIDNL